MKITTSYRSPNLNQQEENSLNNSKSPTSILPASIQGDGYGDGMIAGKSTEDWQKILKKVNKLEKKLTNMAPLAPLSSSGRKNNQTI